MEQGSLRPIQVVAVTGGKGGVGKTNVSVNLGVAMARLGRRVTLLDADLGLANVDVLLGLKHVFTAEGKVGKRLFRIVYGVDDDTIIPLSIIPITGFPIARRGLRGNTP